MNGLRDDSQYIDLWIVDNDLVLDPSNQPLMIDDRASIAQDIAHLIRDSGLLVTLVAERDRLRQRDCIQQIELKVEVDVRLVPGTARMFLPDPAQPGVYLVTATTVQFGHIKVTL
ncbi:DUF2590 family protein [Pseudomonas sp. CCI4.2]|uniref:DUF2590 family protein n=1 Tax=Pseudomonas sp. CCI4.2 TaxID=3048620 RepID=UPI002AC9678D|nr:DUF2590 family protein [Pseudomonas sp. CCI4.2]MEB0090076.1 DUF2590 family protein [Pseudomonas sp. CCI4.2]WPX53460.1 DUF2590 family protein [Pseudomonas sp. CCI4.2]